MKLGWGFLKRIYFVGVVENDSSEHFDDFALPQLLGIPIALVVNLWSLR